MNSNETQGNKFQATRDMDVAAIAKLVRADIKALKIAGLVCSVTIERFSGGRSINVRVKTSPVQIWTDAFVASNPNEYFDGQRYTDEAKDLLAQLEAILQAYNRDNSDSQTDYFDVKFYGHAEFSSDATKADRANTIARKVAASTAEVAQADATIAACEARIAVLQVERAQSKRDVESARLAYATTLAELAATAGYFLGNA